MVTFFPHILGWTGSYHLEKDMNVAEVTKPLNDGMTL
jgi:hypothetical protein